MTESAAITPLADLAAGGAHRVLAVTTSAWRCWSSCRQYRENLAEALDEYYRRDRRYGASTG